MLHSDDAPLSSPCPLSARTPPVLPHVEGMYACPITGKVFTEHTHIAAVKTTGNVYAYEAVSMRACDGVQLHVLSCMPDVR
jgi:hypothetical protein